jgi:O-antigen/teichoic acid export membrane protein
LSSSLFPRFAKAAAHDGLQMAVTSVRLMLVIMTPLMVVAILLSHPFLELWISTQFADQAALVLQILLVGFWINGLARIPHARLQATGRPKVVAICHLIEILPYLGLLYIGLQIGGVAGAAMAFSLRVLVDHLLLSGQSNTLRPTFGLTLSGLVILIGTLLLTQLNTPILIKSSAGTLVVLLTILWAALQAPDALKERARTFYRRA